MKPINIFALTRVKNTDDLQRMERQMSGRDKLLKIKEWEIQGLRKVSDHLCDVMEQGQALYFYYSFIMPKLGKEFDVLRISDDYVINIELKSQNVPEDAIRKQLIQNRYYLSTLGKEIYSYTYITEQDRLYKLSNSLRIHEATWESLAEHLTRQKECYAGDIEALFKEEQYLISPLSDPEHFLRKEYFLTSQQYDIKRRILRTIQQFSADVSHLQACKTLSGVLEQKMCVQGFTGLPGTGKSILLYDIALELSQKEKICFFHLGSWPEELGKLNERLRRIDFYYGQPEDEFCIQEEYGAILVDEAHQITSKNLSGIMSYAKRAQIPVIFSYDREDVIAEQERNAEGEKLIEAIPGLIRYQLTNRIRVNEELSSFVRHFMQRKQLYHRRSYPSVRVVYANNTQEAELLLGCLEKEGFQYLYSGQLQSEVHTEQEVDIRIARSREYDYVAMLVDSGFYYDEKQMLRSVQRSAGVSRLQARKALSGGDKFVSAAGDNPLLKEEPLSDQNRESAVRLLYQGLNRAKKEIAVLVLQNETVFSNLLQILQK